MKLKINAYIEESELGAWQKRGRSKMSIQSNRIAQFTLVSNNRNAKFLIMLY